VTAGAPVVLFDLDDTLMAHREAVAAGIVRYMRERAYEGDEELAARRWHELEEEHYHAYLGGALSFEGQRRARAAAIAREFGEELDVVDASAWCAQYCDR
jgi:putative hydrolase of the HAD superfamily